MRDSFKCGQDSLAGELSGAAQDFCRQSTKAKPGAATEGGRWVVDRKEKKFLTSPREAKARARFVRGDSDGQHCGHSRCRCRFRSVGRGVSDAPSKETRGEMGCEDCSLQGSVPLQQEVGAKEISRRRAHGRESNLSSTDASSGRRSSEERRRGSEGSAQGWLAREGRWERSEESIVESVK